MNGNPELDRESDDGGGLACIPSVKAALDQLAERMAILRAEEARRNAGVQIRRSV
jgi:hypothetical protein